MSRHHRAQNWTSFNEKRRAELAAQLPLPCVNCGRPVTKEDRWHVGHKRDAALGGKATRANTGAAHTLCNLRAGGKLGARMTNGRRRPATDIREW
ncbi:HNH endonuclease [Gryllotalpicola koreensis]|uniref:HNH endonuclease n=1 Tax=Gryllotalpicola koreensis TaxID=993086 RepID=UPI0031E253F2